MSQDPIVVVEVLRRAQGYLAEKGCDTPRLDAEILLADVLDCGRLDLYTGFDRPLTTTETDRYRAAIARRAAREPVAYITGRRGFRNLDVTVGPDVLVPRPETELLVDWVLEVTPPGGCVLDWGTGSGVIAIAVATERSDVVVTGIDRSAAALDVARANDPDGGVEWVASDGFAALAGRTFDVIVANPPYLAEHELAQLAPELGFEPRGALVAGPTGLECYRSIAASAADHLAADGWLLCEVGAGQADEVAALLAPLGAATPQVRHDLAGHARCVGVQR